ncbi:MAG: 30S ribosome-binding factor RbfA [Deltaproteobacteria bacterium]|jgi:ribosome-binding factor A|nr:30S ribosome-binding factor RbfA [Deltaproteobacteria bacterium]
MKGRRQEKVGTLIKNYCSSLFVSRIDDPRLRGLTVTRCLVSADLRSAKVFYSILGGEEERETAKAALKKAVSFVRSNLGKDLGLRSTPQLTFIYDKNPGYAQKVLELLAENRKDPIASESQAQDPTTDDVPLSEETP